MEVIKPAKLNLEDTIGVISPSQCIYIEDEHKKGFDDGIQKLAKLGFKVKLGKYTNEKYFYSAGTAKQRVEDLHNMFSDPEVKAILMSIGGDTANELLPLLDFDLIRNNPKILMGMSDGTTLLSTITDKTGLVTFYGPDLIYSFGIQKDTEPFEKQMFKCLMEGVAEFTPLGDLVDDDGNKIENGWKTVREGSAEGRLIGGYLEIMLDLIATGYVKDLEGKILYLESMESSNAIHMRLQYLNLLGVFNKISGLILGYFPEIKKNEKYCRPIEDIVCEITKDSRFPILKVNELGHMVKNYTWPNGIRVKLNATNKYITALETCIKSGV